MAFDTNAVIVKGGIAFTPTITFGGASVGVTYTNQTGFLYHVAPGVMLFTARCILSSKGTSTGNAVVRLPATDTNGQTIPTPALRTCHSGLTSVLSGSYTGGAIQYEQINGSLSINLLTEASDTVTNLTNADFSAGTNVYVSGHIFYTP